MWSKLQKKKNDEKTEKYNTMKEQGRNAQYQINKIIYLKENSE